MTIITVTSVPASTVAKGTLQITARTRAVTDKATGKKAVIDAANRSRSIIIPEFQPQVSSKYVACVVALLMEAGKDQLGEQWEQTPSITETDSALYTEDALLAFLARKSESKKLTGDAIAAWWNQSGLKAHLVSSNKYSDKQLGALVEQLKNIAAPTPDYNEEKALKRIATLGMVEADLEHEVCAGMIAKLQRIIDKIKAERDAIGSAEELEI